MLFAVWGSGSSPAKSYSKDYPREVSVAQFFRILGDVFSLRCTEPANPLENQLVYRSAAFRYCGFLMNLAKRRNQDQHVSPGADRGDTHQPQSSARCLTNYDRIRPIMTASSPDSRACRCLRRP